MRNEFLKLSNREAWSSTYTASISFSESNEALLSPTWTPRVLDGPCIITCSNKEYSMVKIRNTIVKDT